MDNIHQKLSSNGLRGALAAHSEATNTNNTNMSGGKKRRSRKNKSHRRSRTVSHKRSSKRCLLYTSPSPRDGLLSRMPSSA